uniref:Uncharacterized protein n=1 Tax=Panagrolaimus superbus TaxID=310955 RepID=A0A914Y4X3_9BILA
MVKKDAIKKFVEIVPCFKELFHFTLYALTEAFDFASITDFLLKNETINVILQFRGDVPMSDAYKKDLEKFISKIIETPPKRMPIIDFPGIRKCIFYNDYKKLCRHHNGR